MSIFKFHSEYHCVSVRCIVLVCHWKLGFRQRKVILKIVHYCQESCDIIIYIMSILVLLKSKWFQETSSCDSDVVRVMKTQFSGVSFDVITLSGLWLFLLLNFPSHIYSSCISEL